MTDTAIAVNNLDFNYGHLKVIDDMTMQIESGTSYGLLGPNGAGKTTLIRLMVGLLKPAGGSILYRGKPPTRSTAKNIGYMPQLPALYSELSVEQNIDFFARIYGMKDVKARSQRVNDTIKIVDLWDKRKTQIINLSGGIGIPYKPDQKAVDLKIVSKGIQEAYEATIRTEGLDPLNIYMEMGRMISGPDGYLVTRVRHIKDIFYPPISQRMIIYKESYASKIGKAIGMQDIQIGTDFFGKEVIIKDSDEYFIRSFLTYDIQEKILLIIEKLRERIILNKEKLEISFTDILNDELLCDELINLRLRLVEKIKEKGSLY